MNEAETRAELIDPLLQSSGWGVVEEKKIPYTTNMLQKYIAYLKDNPQGYWFKRKLFGWGWVPATWQGWLVVVLYLILVLAFAFTIDENSPPQEVMFTFILPLLLLTGALIRICYKTGETPRWQWGVTKKDPRK